MVVKHPLYKDVTQADLEAQFALAIRIRDKLSEANQAVIRIRDIKGQVTDRLGKSQDRRLKTVGDTLVKQISAVEEQIYQVRNQSGQDPLNFPIKVNNRIGTLNRSVNTGDGAPIANAEPIFNDLVQELKVQTDALERDHQHGVAEAERRAASARADRGQCRSNHLLIHQTKQNVRAETPSHGGKVPSQLSSAAPRLRANMCLP